MVKNERFTVFIFNKTHHYAGMSPNYLAKSGTSIQKNIFVIMNMI
jgi:hypothetical protein